MRIIINEKKKREVQQKNDNNYRGCDFNVEIMRKQKEKSIIGQLDLKLQNYLYFSTKYVSSHHDVYLKEVIDLYNLNLQQIKFIKHDSKYSAYDKITPAKIRYGVIRHDVIRCDTIG